MNTDLNTEPEPIPTRAGTLAVVDIGSNSIRLVVYDRHRGGAAPMFNEKVLCGLGRGMAKTGQLNPDGVKLARDNLVRFTRLAHALGVERIDLLATAAVREAEDGPAFSAEVEALTGHPVRVLSGQEEARLSALGVVAGFTDPHGIVGDLGGGSLELVELTHGRPGRSISLPLGPLKLIESCGGKEADIAREVDRQLGEVDWLKQVHGTGTFFAVGGAWRNLARINIDQRRYPLHVIHGYHMRRDEIDRLSAVIGRQSKRSLSRIKGVTKARLEILPTASVVLSRVVRILGCDEVRFSAFGLREGYAFDLLPAAEQELDPLLTACTAIARRDVRFDDMGEPLMAWTDPLFPREPAAARRLRYASCLLSDIAWREHPDYRSSQALIRILHYPFTGLSHVERVCLGLAAYVRYGDSADNADFKPYQSQLSAEDYRAVLILGLAQRLAYQLSGASREVLAQCALRLDDERGLQLVLPKDGTVPVGEAAERRLVALAEALETKAYVIGG